MTGPSLGATTGIAIQGSAIQPNGAFSPSPATALQTSGSSVSCYVGPLTAVLIRVAAPPIPPLTVISSANSTTREIPGEGVSPLPRILRALTTKGYAGPLSVELFYPHYQETDPYQMASRIREKAEPVMRAAGVA